jgi:acyl carrier protein
MNIENRTIDAIKSILQEFGIPEAAITLDARLREDLELDSTEAVDLSLELYKRFGVKMKIETQEKLTVADLCQLVAQATEAARIS